MAGQLATAFGLRPSDYVGIESPVGRLRFDLAALRKIGAK